MFIKVHLQLALDVRVACEVVYDGTGGAGGGDEFQTRKNRKEKRTWRSCPILQ